MPLPILCLKKNEERRLREGHVWVYSNEVDIRKSPLKQFKPGEEVLIQAANQEILGTATINPQSLITARLYSRNPQERLNVSLLSTRLEQALQLREALFSKPYYRLAFAESDELPGVVIDRFAQELVVQCNTAGMDHRKAELIEAIRNVLPNTQALLFRNDSAIRQQEGLESEIMAGFGQPSETCFLEENETTFQAPLWQGQKTGWFFDHRLNRARLKDYVEGQDVLDVFSYLGAFGIQAARFGAKEVHCVDRSALACEWIQKNASLNRVQSQVKVRCEEAITALQSFYHEKMKFDFIILDPPAFIKRRKDQSQGFLAYQRLNTLALKLLRPGGILLSCSCSMHLLEENLIKLLQRAALLARCRLQLLERGHQGPDHPVHLAIPETNYLKAIMVRRLV